MPELPEVETIVRDLNKSLARKTFSDVIVHDAFVLRQKPAEFIRRIKNQTIEKITRRGKAIIAQLGSPARVSGHEEGFLVIQLMMTGQLIIDGRKEKHTRITFNFSDGRNLVYNDQRRFGQIRLVERLDQIPHFNILGPEPFSKEFTPAFMREAFQNRTRPVKNILLDHTFVAGIGNIYASEILFRSRVSPKRQGRRITLEETKTVHRFIVEVLKEAITHRGSSMRNYLDSAGKKGRFNERLAVYAREDLPCPRCQKLILRITQAGRSTFYCGHCQK
jgi:formamidopyrimidine-DNA glycosylase